jgi:hypothetical protein
MPKAQLLRYGIVGFAQVRHKAIVMHARYALIFLTLGASLACATVAPSSIRVTGAIHQTRVGAVLPPRFNWNVGGVDVWAAINTTMNGISTRSKLALIDPREIEIGSGDAPPVATFWADTNLADVASRMSLNEGQILLIEPVIERENQKKKIRSGGQTIFVNAATYKVHLNLWIDGKSAGKVIVTRAIAPIDLAVLEDEITIWLDALDESTAQLATELKSVRIRQAIAPSYLRENIASMASTTLPGLPSAIAIPDTLRRLAQMDRLMRAAGLNIHGVKLEKALELQPGLLVLKDTALLKAGDLIVSAETQPLRHPLTFARLRAFGVIHLEVIREGKVINLMLEPK